MSAFTPTARPTPAGAIPADATPCPELAGLSRVGAFAIVEHVEPLFGPPRLGRATGEQAMLLPADRRTHKGIQIVEPADPI